MSELVGRFLSFEEHMGRSLVKFVYYVLLFLLVVSTLFEMVAALIAMFSDRFWPNLGQFLVLIPLRFFVALLLLRVGAELVIAVLSIDDNLQNGQLEVDVMSSGLNPAPVPQNASRMSAEGPGDTGEPATEEPPAEPAPARKTAKKTTKKKAAKKAAPAKTGESASNVKRFEPEGRTGSTTETPGVAKDTASKASEDETKKD